MKKFLYIFIFILILVIIGMILLLLWVNTSKPVVIQEVESFTWKTTNYLKIKKNKILEEKKKKIDFINSLDLKTDSSVTKYINNKISFNEKDYIPNDLTLISSVYIFDLKWNWQLRYITNLALQELWKDFYKEFSKKLNVVSAFRSYSYQKWIKDGGCLDRFCAKAGYSEHQSWLAFDLFSVSNKEEWEKDLILKKYYIWLDKNAYKYGFTNTYKKWLEVDWYEIEPWHWRYIWKELALYLHEKNITFGEFYKLNNN